MRVSQWARGHVSLEPNSRFVSNRNGAGKLVPRLRVCDDVDMRSWGRRTTTATWRKSSSGSSTRWNSTTMRLIMFCVTARVTQRTHLSTLAHSLWFHCDRSLHKSARTQRLPRTWSLSSWLNCLVQPRTTHPAADPGYSAAVDLWCFLTAPTYQTICVFSL